MTKILIVEDDKEINNLLKDFLLEEGYNTISAFNGIEALSILREEDVDIVLLDIMLPFQSGDVILNKLRKFSDVPVIIISAKDSVQTKIDVIRMGADDYITKPFDIDEVLVRIEATLRRSNKKEFNKNSKLYYKNLILDTESKTAVVNGKVLSITAKEYSILELMLKNKNKLFSKSNLFESVWNESYLNDDSTLKVHMSNLRSKIKEYDCNNDYIETVWGMGYKLKN